MKKVTILGAGITGLSLGDYLSEKGFEVEILEKSETIGGMAKSFKYKNNILDFGPHKIYTQIPGVIEEFKKISGKGNLLRVEKKNSLYLLGKRFGFPARIPQIVLGINPLKSAMLGLGFGAAMTKNILRKKKNRTYEDYFISGFGKPAYELLFKDLAWKVWGDPETLSEELARKRVPVPNLVQLVFSGKGKDSDGRELSAKHFYYPKYDGIGFVNEKYAEKIRGNGGRIILGARIERINKEKDRVVSIEYDAGNGLEKSSTDFVASTIYLKDNLEMMNPSPPKKIMGAVSGLKYRGLILVYLFVNKPRAMEENWVFFPEKKFLFNRVSEHNSFSRHIVEKGKSILTAEITCESDSEVFNSSDNYLYRRVIEGLETAGIVREEEVSEFLIMRARRIYPVYDLDYRNNLGVVLDYFDSLSNAITLGRQGLYNYNNTDHCIDMSLKAADYIENWFKGAKNIKDWDENRNYFDTYRIVD